MNIIRTPNEHCELHNALMNVGYTIYRKNYCIAGKYTGQKVDYYAPAIDYSDYRDHEPVRYRRSRQGGYSVDTCGSANNGLIF